MVVVAAAAEVGEGDICRSRRADRRRYINRVDECKRATKSRQVDRFHLLMWVGQE